MLRLFLGRTLKMLLSAIEDLLVLLMPDQIATAETTAVDPGQDTPNRIVNRLLRVDESKIDALIDLAGELLVMKTVLRISLRAPNGR